jgi:hypothetical protein
MRKQIIWLSLLPAMLAFGCGQRAEQKPSNVTPATEAAVPLPEWAPKSPSPEFLRAARVLKPGPKEAIASFAQGELAQVALVERLQRTWPAAYEFFGTLTDEQIERFLSVRQVRMPIRSLAPQQRSALDNWFETWRNEMTGNPSLPEDFLVVLFKLGARDDLSNVDVGVDAQSEGRVVTINFWVALTAGKVAEIGANFAYL